MIVKTGPDKQQADGISADSSISLCYAMLPPGDCDGYKPGHFTRVYEDIIKPACSLAGFQAIRAEETKPACLINLDVLQKTLHSAMAICDLSSRDPGVFFQLGFRLAFDKPTVLIQEAGKPKIFDIPTFKHIEYRKDLRYREVLEDQKVVVEAMHAETGHCDNGARINSLARILSLTNLAKLSDDSELDTRKLLQLVHYEMSSMHSEVQRLLEYLPMEREKLDFRALCDDFNVLGESIPLLQVEEYYVRARRLHALRADHKEVSELLKLARNKLIEIVQAETDVTHLSRARDLLIRVAEFEKHVYAVKAK